ncbi:MAG: hypothetical protein QNJ53_15235 [Pleurocapsa sp. MO_192.B19]|nr:hypothetical protein [Pleurocapsa sp. MO_192.B19]
MVITAISTRQPPQAPSTPVVAQQALSDLVNYYRELAQYHRSSVDYHRQLLEQHTQEAEVAEKQLASIEAILHPLTTESVKQDINGKQANGTGKITSLEDTGAEAAKDTPVAPEVTTVEPEESKVEEITTDDKKPETKASKSVTQSSPKKNGKLGTTSSKAAKTKKPTKNKNNRQTKKSTKAFSSRLPYSEKLAARETIVDAVAFCLQEYYPTVINAEDVVKYYYPEGLEGETKKRAYGAFSNCLSKGAGKQGWVRSSIGKYRWQEGS